MILLMNEVLDNVPTIGQNLKYFLIEMKQKFC